MLAGSALAAGKRAPQAKTKDELAAYERGYAMPNADAVEHAADEFSAKYPSSELTPLLYQKALRAYQAENNPRGMLLSGEKVLAREPGNAVALALTATVLSDAVTEKEAADPKNALTVEARRNATRALTAEPPSAGTQEQRAAFQKTIRTLAHSSLGTLSLKQAKYAEAERELRQALSDSAASAPYLWYHLSLAQDHLKKSSDALASAERATKFAASNADLLALAQKERERLTLLAPKTKTPR